MNGIHVINTILHIKYYYVNREGIAGSRGQGEGTKRRRARHSTVTTCKPGLLDGRSERTR